MLSVTIGVLITFLLKGEVFLNIFSRTQISGVIYLWLFAAIFSIGCAFSTRHKA
jgi:hypothetical protein